MTFFKAFLISPRETGAVAPSSKALSALITDTADLSNKTNIVELGSGTGVFTKEIIKKIDSKSLFFSLEINEEFVTETKKNCPNALVYQASAEDIGKYLVKHNADSCDCVISGLPWAAFNKRLQEKLLDTVFNSLQKGGVFLTFAYLQGSLLPSGINFKKQLNQKFSFVWKTRIIWNNLPPAFVYYCKK